MKTKRSSYDDEEYYRADILGTGSYQRIGGIGTTKMKAPIGFVRPKQKEAPKQVVRKK
jgi:hypothetical protein